MRLIYFSPVPWDSYEQRPHYFARYFLAQGGRAVTWINPYVARLPRWSDAARLRHPQRELRLERPEGLSVVTVGALPIDPLPLGPQVNGAVFWRAALKELAAGEGPRTILGIGRPTALALASLRVVPHAWSFYDAMDMFPEFYRGLSKRFTRNTELEIARRVTRVFASSTALADKFRRLGRTVSLMRNAYDMSLLPPVANVTDGPGRDTLGFLGCMGQWFDWDLTVRIAEAARPMKVTLVGPRPAPGPLRLPDNVTWHPECHQADTVRHMSRFAAGLIPFRRDALTDGIDPIKYYQYRGVGLPVLTTAFGEMTSRGGHDDTFFVDDPTTLPQALKAAVARRPDARSIHAFREENSWTARFAAARATEPE